MKLTDINQLIIFEALFYCGVSAIYTQAQLTRRSIYGSIPEKLMVTIGKFTQDKKLSYYQLCINKVHSLVEKCSIIRFSPIRILGVIV
jgi:hypothetical protein